MIKITTNGEPLDLPSDFTFTIEDTNPIYNERGSQSVPATVPVTRRNIRLLNAPHRIDSGIDPNNPQLRAEITSGTYRRSGLINVTEAGRKEGITFNIGFDNSTAYASWADTKLRELPGLPVFVPSTSGLTPKTMVEHLIDNLDRIYAAPKPQSDDFALFSVVVGSDDDFTELLNAVPVLANKLSRDTTITRKVNDETTQITVPLGYGISPFLRVWRVVELIFSAFGLEIVRNPFKENLELAKLVVLNNVFDSCCRGTINYADLMPDCTVSEFLNSLWVRFGLVYNINEGEGTVSLEFIRDILGKNSNSIDNSLASYEKIIYETPQYVKLSAATSIDGAAPACSRFEDFARGIDPAQIRVGANVAIWRNSGSPDSPKWDGDLSWDADERDPDPIDPEFPDIDDDIRDDGDLYSSRSAAPAARAASASSDSNTCFLAVESVTGIWYKLDATNSAVKASSSGFFDWDPQTEGCEALELASIDECVPIRNASRTMGVPTGQCPFFLVGSRHFHSYIEGTDTSSDESDTDRTPLAFMFAYTLDGHTLGRLNGERSNALPMRLDDGTTPSLSLLFQFKDGLFATFWADYDELLRHGNRSVEVDVRYNKAALLNVNTLQPVSLRGIKCLVDTLSYSLPAGKEVSVSLKLRTIQASGDYDIVSEQHIPEFSAAARRLEWQLVEETFGTNLDTQTARQEASQNFIKREGYRPHGVDGDQYYVDSNSAYRHSVTRVQPTWENDPELDKPSATGQVITRSYKAYIAYDIYEIHDCTIQGGEEKIGLAEWLSREIVTVEYSVTLKARLVMCSAI